MAFPVLVPYDFNKFELQNIRFQNLAADISGPVAGLVYWNTISARAKIHDGSAWQSVPFIPTSGTPAALTVAGTAVLGSSLFNAPLDHVHAMPGLATSGASGFMVNTDKAKLDAATNANTVSTLAMRDANGRMQASDPVAALDVVNLQTLQSLQQGLDIKGSVRCATTAAGTLASSFANGQAVDGITLATGDRILIKNQAAPAENGIYTVNASGAPTRATDMDAWTEFPGAFCFVEQGTTNADTGWVCTSDAGGTLGTTAVTFVQFSGAGSYTAANDPGITGVGVYDNTTGSQFRFRAIKAGSSKVSVTLSTKDILVDVNEANLTHDNIGGTLGVAKGGTGATTAAAARTNLGAPGKYAVSIGNGSLTSITVNHALGTTDVTVQVWETGGSKRQVGCEIQITDANNVVCVFSVAPAASAYRVVVIG